MADVLLELNGVAKAYPVGRQTIGRKKRLLHALRPLSLQLGDGEILAVVGESGCGKSTLARIMAFVTPPTEGLVRVEGLDPGTATTPAAVGARRRVQLIHQDPYAALNPRKTVESILVTPMVAHRLAPAAQARGRARELLETVGLSPAANFLGKFPYEMSGGQRQRVVIARALTVEPKVLVADEAVSMIDVSLRQSILATLRRLRDERGLAVVFITHDLAQARYFAGGHRILVMYAGQVVEEGPTEEVIMRPRHPYTAVLRSAVLDPNPRLAKNNAVAMADGAFPDLTQEVKGCIFASRCPIVQEICQAVAPPLASQDGSHAVACHFGHDRMLEDILSQGRAAADLAE
jgi:oligopeptide/dipeptide ABC transporter ATP-binding protein